MFINDAIFVQGSRDVMTCGLLAVDVPMLLGTALSALLRTLERAESILSL